MQQMFDPADTPELLAGLTSPDDAAVWKLDDETAIIHTVDFFPPICGDPYEFGRIAAVNALSDVFAMGGRPLTALNIAAFPSARIDVAVLGEILRGGADAVAEAGAVVAGGHTIDDFPPKYGLAVTGVVHPDRVIRNCAARPGDAIILTKPLGTGTLVAGQRIGEAAPEHYRAALDTMMQLNRRGAEIMQKYGVRCATDITGFGLLGHLHKMCRASGVGAVIDRRAVPVIDAALDALRDGYVSGGTRRNLDWVRPYLRPGSGVTEDDLLLLADAQTSGGLLVVGEVPWYPVIGHTVAGDGIQVRI